MEQDKDIKNNENSVEDRLENRIEKPKKKNNKHIQVIRHLPEEVRELLSKELTDITVKRAIKLIEK